MKSIFPRLFADMGSFYTPNLIPAKRVYGERLVQDVESGMELRFWDPFRSKLAAALKNGWKNVPFVESQKILYLGCAEGTTCSHLSDIVGQQGLLLGVDVSATSMRRFITLCEQRENMAPLLSDASNPKTYPESVQTILFDVMAQDIAQKNQVGIFLENAHLLRKGGSGLLVIKARSSHVTKSAFELVAAERKRLETVFHIKEIISLEPFERHHALVVLEKK